MEPAEGSLYDMSMESQHHWSHRLIWPTSLLSEIPTSLSILNPGSSRYSTTFRSVAKNYKNSTIIIGDSNTKHLKFSTGKHREMGIHLDTTCRGNEWKHFTLVKLIKASVWDIETFSFTVKSMTSRIIPHVDKCSAPFYQLPSEV